MIFLSLQHMLVGKIYSPIIFFLLSIYSFSQGTWVQKTSFGGTARQEAIGFTIGNKAYIGTGWNGSCMQDFWEWDPLANTWTQKADFTGGSRQGAYHFSIGSKGYIGMGWNCSTELSDFWEWDQSTNIWIKKADFPATPMQDGVSFSIGTKGYVGTGYNMNSNGYFNVFWEWDQVTNVWTQKNNFPGVPRCGSCGFSIGNKGYIGMGVDGANNLYNDFWEWDQLTNTWTQKANFSGTARMYASGFTLCNNGYVGAGKDMNSFKQDLWEWNQVTNTWKQQANLPAVARFASIGISIGNKGYLGTGGLFPAYQFFNDFWEFAPSATPSSNLLVNGDFSLGNTGFISGYTYATFNTVEGEYWVGTSPQLWNGGMSNCQDHTSGSGNMLCVNGATSGANTPFYCQTVTVIPNNNYILALWGASAFPGNPADIMFSINNTSLTPSVTLPTSVCSWQQYSVLWYSGNSSTAAICIIDQDMQAFGNDFAIDDISFQPCGCTPPSQILITGNTTLCEGQSTTLSATGGTSYTWSTGSSSSTIIITPSTTTSYSVVASNSCGTDTASITIIVNQIPTASVLGDTTICSGSLVTLTASGGNNYLWNTGESTSSIIVSPAGNSSYSVIATMGSCTASATASVTVISSPTVTITSSPVSTTICNGDTVTLNASGGSVYMWSNGSSASSISVAPSTTITYTVTTNNGYCSNTTGITITVQPPPVATISGNTAICQGNTATLTASGGGTYLWSSGQTTSVIHPNSAGTYSVFVSVGTCKDTAVQTITVNPNPSAYAFSDTTITQGGSANLSASGGSTYIWDNGMSGNIISVFPLVTTVYCVTVRDANNCSDTDCVTVTVEPIDCSVMGELYLPNAFSPNKDNENDELQVYYGNFSCIQYFNITVYNLWGEKVYETTDPAFKWDGTFRDKKLDSGVYAYYLATKLINGEEILRKGNVSLLR